MYELAKQYHLDVSLFERLVMNGVEHVSLMRQRRMRPEISEMIRPLYPGLRDHPDVLKVPLLLPPVEVSTDLWRKRSDY